MISVLILASFLCAVYSVHLTSSTFADFIKSNSVVVVMFYAPWCSISKNLMPKYDESVEDFKAKGIVLAKVNCVDEADLYWKYDIKGFPTIAVFNKGDSAFYSGELTMSEIKKFIMSMSTYSVSEIDPQTFYSVDLSKKPLAISLALPNDSERLLQFDMACKKFNFPHCYTSSSVELAALLGATLPSVVIVKEFKQYGLQARELQYSQEEIEVTADTFPNSDALFDWMKQHAFPALVEHSEGNGDVIFQDKRPGFDSHCIVFLDSKKQVNAHEVLDAAASAGKQFMNKIVMTFTDANRKDEESQERTEALMEDAEVSAADFPTAVIIRSKGNSVKFYRYHEKGFDSAGLNRWIQAFLDGSEIPYRVVGEP